MPCCMFLPFHSELNITQHMRRRSAFLNASFWAGVPAVARPRAAGKGEKK